MEDIISANEQINQWCDTKNIDYYKGDCALSNLFKYAVSFLVKDDYQFSINCTGSQPRKWFVSVTKWGKHLRGAPGGNEILCFVTKEHKGPALALFWALHSLIGKATAHTKRKVKMEDKLLLTELDIGNIAKANKAIGWLSLTYLKPYLEAQLTRVKQHYPIMYKEYADLVGWLLDNGWIPLGEVERVKQEAINTAITAYESTCEALIVEAKREERKEIFSEVEKHPLVELVGTKEYTLESRLWWQNLKERVR